MILSCLTTANNLLAIAAADMTVRMVNLKRAEVFIRVVLLILGMG
jgi:hypothetical protein